MASLAMLIWAGMCWCAAPGPGDSRPLDQRLLKELNSRPGDEIDRELFGPEEKAGPAVPPKPGSSLPKPADVPAPPARDLSRVFEQENPLVDIARQMREAERLIAQAHSGEKTREVQEQIVRQLDGLLQRVCKQCGGTQCTPSACKEGIVPRDAAGSPKRKPDGPSEYQRPTQRSEKKLDPVSKAGERPTLGRNPKVDADQRHRAIQGAWGSLPERERQQMMRLLPPEQFLPKYEPLIEEYYRRLGGESRSE
jgi:hypothetical protein